MRMKTVQDLLDQEHITGSPQELEVLCTRIGDLVLDGSIRTQLINMKESLKRGERV